MRTAILSIRDERPVPWLGCQVEAEDALVASLGSALHRLRPSGPVFRTGLLASGHVRRLMSWSRLLRPMRIVTDPTVGADRADVLLVMINDLHDASLLLSVPRWHELGELVLLHVAEVNERHLRIYPEVVRHLRRRVDHLFVSTPGEWMARMPADRLRSVDHLPVPLDVPAFTPRPVGRRSIDVLNLGRRHPAQHALLLAWAAHGDRFYLHDTGYVSTLDSQPEHRAQFRSLAGRSRAFVTNFAAAGASTRRSHPVPAVGARFYEAMAAGCLLVGDVPAGAGRLAEITPAEPVRWQVDAPAVPAELNAVLDDPVEWSRRSASGRIAALSVADIAHRWDEMATRAGLPAHPGIVERHARLAAEAETVRAAAGTNRATETVART